MTNLNTLAEEIFEANKRKGFWDSPRPLTETTMLIVTELSEAVEEERAGKLKTYYRDPMYDMLHDAETVTVGDDHLARTVHAGLERPLKPEGIDVELIDALIRLLDLLGSRGTDVDGLLEQKLAFNATRAPRHGKGY